jgi:glycerate dehydrogenase
MKKSAFLINTARGGIVDEDALAQALRAGMIAGAGVDVLSKEPPTEGNPLLTPDIPNLLITPHTAWASNEALQRLMDQIAETILAFKSGQPRNIVV